MKKIENAYIRKAKRKKLLKKIIFFLILLMGVALYIVFYTDYFIINKVVLEGNNLITEDYILDKSESVKGKNLVTFNKNNLEKILKKNPYVEQLKITRKFPKTLVINVEEAKGLFYIENNNAYSIISSDLIYLENKNKLDSDEYIKITGVDLSKKKLGDKVLDNSRMIAVLNELYDEQGIIEDNKEEFRITSVNLADLSKLSVTLNDITVYLGTDENIRDKMSDAILIYKSDLPKEYINVGFDGTPDFK